MARDLFEKRLPKAREVLKPKLVAGMLNTEEAVLKARQESKAAEDHDD